MRPYAIGGPAYLRRDAEAVGPVLMLYCHSPSMVLTREAASGQMVVSPPTGWTASEYCAQAAQEADTVGAELGVESGIGLETSFLMPPGATIAFEIRYVRGLGRTGTAFVPMQVGVVLPLSF